MYQTSTDIIIVNHVSAEMMELFGGKRFQLRISDVLPKSPYILSFLCHGTVAIVTTIATIKWQTTIQLSLSHIQKLYDATAVDCIKHIVAIG